MVFGERAGAPRARGLGRCEDGGVPREAEAVYEAMVDRIALVTRHRPGGWSLSIQRGFEANGLTCELIPYGNWFPALHLPGVRGSGGLTQAVKTALRPAMELRLLVELRRIRPDAVVFLKTDDLHRALYRAARRALGVPLIAYHPDDPFNQGTLLQPGPSHRRAITQLREVDVFACWSRPILERATAVGARQVLYLPFAADPELHPKIELTEADRAAFGADVTFVGNWDPSRERWMQPIARFCEDEGIDLAIWGNDYWGVRCADPRVRRAWRGRPLTGLEMAKAALASKINLNLLRVQNRGATNMRTMEIPCSGGFMLHERSEALGELLPPGEACDDFATPEELAAKVRRYLGDPAARERIAAAGHARAMGWTYREWTQEVLLALAGTTEGGGAEGPARSARRFAAT